MIPPSSGNRNELKVSIQSKEGQLMPKDKKNLLTPELLKAIQSAMSTSVKPEATINSLPTKVVGENKKSSFVNTLLKGAATLAPIAASAIPGAGPIISTLLSTLNDDDWFEQYKSAGASFNELLVTRLNKTNTAQMVNVSPRAAFAFVQTNVNERTQFTDSFMPSVLAYIRMKTNNVLVDDVTKYTETFIASSRLYALYYSLEKYVTLAQRQPINIPVMSQLIAIISPENLNKLIGIRDALRSYLQSTVRLPYAWVQMLRWRFGTAFHAFNTGQPGLIMYDLTDNVYESLDDILDIIATAQTTILQAGRAAADMKLAYVDHTIQYDVENSHYDEKEYNLRVNMSMINRLSPSGLIELIKDSRLAMSPAIQASTISTEDATEGTNLRAPLVALPISTIRFATFIFNEDVPMGDLAPPAKVRKILNYIFEALDTENLAGISGWKTYNFDSSVTNADIRLFLTGNNFQYAPGNTTASSTKSHGNSVIITPLAMSLGFDHLSANTPIGSYPDIVGGADQVPNATVFLYQDRVSYDYARINNSTLQAIQTAAIRNLTRGDYKQKASSTETSETAKNIALAAVDVVKS